jgi:hypothetical protein
MKQAQGHQDFTVIMRQMDTIYQHTIMTKIYTPPEVVLYHMVITHGGMRHVGVVIILGMIMDLIGMAQVGTYINTEPFI